MRRAHPSVLALLLLTGTYNPTESTSTKTTIVFFLGGCTYTEIAALRFMAKQTKGRKFLILTTGMINGTKVSFHDETMQDDGVSGTLSQNGETDLQL